MTIEMKEIFNHQIDTYKKLRNELTADTELSDQEKDWMLTNIQQSIHHQSQILELELS
jgi:lipase chaperone LimK